MRDICLGFGIKYDNGHEPYVSINQDNTVLEVHSSEGKLDLYYKVGIIIGTEIRWLSSGGHYYDDGIMPSCGLMKNGTAIEIHQSEGSRTLYYHVGQLADDRVTWVKDDSVELSSGMDPSVCVNDSDFIVEAHSASIGWGLINRVGKLNSDRKTITWGTPEEYDVGYRPRISINNKNQIVAVHRSSSGGATSYYRAGKLDTRTKTIKWGPSTECPRSMVQCSVALTDDNQVFFAYRSSLGGYRLNSITGSLDPITNTINWDTDRFLYDEGVTPSIACNNKILVEAHQSEVGRTIWASSSLIYDRAQWMHNNYAQLENKTLQEITIPGCHDAGMIMARGEAPKPAFNQNLSFKDQLLYGARYFDLRPEHIGGKFYINHSLTIGESLENILADAASFMRESRELVILKFSHYAFFSNPIYREMLQMIYDKLSAWMLTSMDNVNLATVELKHFLNNQGHGTVLIVCDDVNDDNFPARNPRSGFHIYKDSINKDRWFTVSNIRVFDVYANTSSYEKMRNDQEQKFSEFNAKSADSTTDLFLLSWTCTPDASGLLMPYHLAKTPNAYLGEEMMRFKIPNRFGRRINIVYTDFFQLARTTDVCLFMNDLVSIAPTFRPIRALEMDPEKPKALVRSTVTVERKFSLPSSTVYDPGLGANPNSFMPRSSVYAQSMAAEAGSFILRSKVHSPQTALAAGSLPSRSLTSKLRGA